MFRYLIPTTAAIMLMASPALAGHCPVDVKKIDEAMQSAQLSEADMAKVMTLRNKGEQMHTSGQHGGSIKALHEAMEILGIGH